MLLERGWCSFPAPCRTSRGNGHLSSVNLTHLELSHLPAIDVRMGHLGTGGKGPAVGADPLPSTAHPDGTSGGNEPRRAGKSLPTPSIPGPSHCPPWRIRVPQPAPRQHLVLHHPAAVWRKRPHFLPPKEVETGRGARRVLTDAQRGLEMLVLPEVIQLSGRASATSPHWLPPCKVCPGHQLQRVWGQSWSPVQRAPAVTCPGIRGQCTAQLGQGHVPAASTVLTDTHGSEPAWQCWRQPHGRRLPLSASRCPFLAPAGHQCQVCLWASLAGTVTCPQRM